MSQHSSNKFKPCKKCGCPSCSRYSKHKQDQIRWGNRKFRKLGRIQPGVLNLANFEDGIVNPGDSSGVYIESSLIEYLEDWEIQKIGIGYTD